MDRRNIKSSTARNYLGLHRPMIKGLYSGQMTSGWITKTTVDCNLGLYMHSEYD